jgi:uncharacterized protein YecT (DUF1311 family)
MRTSALLLTLLVAPCLAFADEDKHPLDAKIDAAADKANSTLETREAYDNGLKLWDAELNRCYGQLKKKLKPEVFASLQAAQRQWLVYRDSQIKFIDQFYAQFDGTMYIPMRSAAVMEVTRARALELYHRLEVLKDNE